MWIIILNSIFLGIGLAMDACAVSMANGLNEPNMKLRKTFLISGTFGIFQGIMPMIGWVCVHFVAQQFDIVTKIIPYIALGLLTFIGVKMIYEGAKNSPKKRDVDDGEDVDENKAKTSDTAFESKTNSGINTEQLTLWSLFTQALATSIDALSVGFTIADDEWWQALVCAVIIAFVTFVICIGAVFVGKKFGTKLGNKAEILGGCILIAIGLEIFITGVIA